VGWCELEVSHMHRGARRVPPCQFGRARAAAVAAVVTQADHTRSHGPWAMAVVASNNTAHETSTGVSRLDLTSTTTNREKRRRAPAAVR
jgi:hypothetical protein